MKNLTPGHKYLLDVIGEPGEKYPGSVLNFLHCEERVGKYEGLPKRGEFPVVTPGTTNEEVLWVLIDRLKFLNAKLPCDENNIAVQHLESALAVLESRTRDRVKRGVESSNTA